MTRRGLTREELERALYESDDDMFDEEIVSESEDDIIEEETQDSDSEISEEEPDDSEEQVTARDGTVWKKKCNTATRRLTRNIITTPPGLTPYSNNIESPLDAFNLIISDDMIALIVEETNRKAKQLLPDDNTYKTITNEEMRAFIGLLILMGTCRAKRESTSDLWNSETAFRRPVFPATMSRNRFRQIMRFIRFDNFETRNERREINKLAAFDTVFAMFVANNKRAYNPNPQLCIDEQLVGFRGRCPFRVYMKSKPDKYGIKIWALCDAENCYAYNLQVYTGMANNQPEREQGKRVVLDLVSGLGSGYGITTDNFFTSLGLATELLQQNKTLLGTIRKTRREIPKDLLPDRSRPEYSTIFLFTRDAMLASYVPKKNRAVILLSTQHHSEQVSDEANNYKPEVILEYNKTKGAVDTLDKMVKEYSCNRTTKRWPLVLFMNMIDVAAINAFILYRIKNPTYNTGKSNARSLFLKDLGLSLVTPNIRARVQRGTSGLHVHVVNAISSVIDLPGPSKQTVQTPQQDEKKRGRCAICPRSKDVKQRARCDSCQIFLCPAHQKKIITIRCPNCSV